MRTYLRALGQCSLGHLWWWTSGVFVSLFLFCHAQQVVLVHMNKMQLAPHVTHCTNSATPKLVYTLFNEYHILECHSNVKLP